MSKLLKQVLKRARKSPFYQTYLPVSDDWNAIPLTTKAQLRSGYPFGFLGVEKNKIATYHESSGTEGKPTSSYFSEKDWKDIASRFNRSAIQLSKNDTFFIKTPYSMVTTAHQAQKAAELRRATVVPGDNRSTNMPYRRVVQLLKDLSVSVSWSLPTEVILWALAAEKLGFDPKKDFPDLRAFWVAGEPLSSSKKQVLQNIWGGKKVYEDYGSTETGSLAGECDDGQLHAWSDRVYFEVYQPESGKIVTQGRGQLVVTPLFREAMPLVRYLIEDEVELESSTCPCGSALPVLQVLGRQSARIEVQGKQLFASEIEAAIYTAGQPYDLSLFRAYHDTSNLDIEFLSRDSRSCAPMIEAHLQKALGIRVKTVGVPIEAFVPPHLFKDKLKFNKPKFLFARGEYQGRSLQYY